MSINRYTPHTHTHSIRTDGKGKIVYCAAVEGRAVDNALLGALDLFDQPGLRSYERRLEVECSMIMIRE